MSLFSLLLWYYKCVIFTLYRRCTVIGGLSPLMTLSITKIRKRINSEKSKPDNGSTNS